ncbi:MAG: hypothetical protein ABFD18_09595 [Syntrophomonas sp.]
MKEMLKKIIDKFGNKALASAKAFEEAAAGLGYDQEQITAVVRDFDGFPLDDDDLMDVAGGIGGQNNYMNSTVGNDFGPRNPLMNSTVGSGGEIIG